LRVRVLRWFATAQQRAAQESFAKTVAVSLNPLRAPLTCASPVKVKPTAKQAADIAWASKGIAIVPNPVGRETFALRVMLVKNPTQDFLANVCPKMGPVRSPVCLTAIVRKAIAARVESAQNPKEADLRPLAILCLVKIRWFANARSAVNAVFPLVGCLPEKPEAPVATEQAVTLRCRATRWLLLKISACIPATATQTAVR